MECKNKTTQKLLKIVKNRKTQIIISKQENNNKRNKNVSTSLAYDSYSNDFTD
jgi:hypothetical protein